MGIYRIGEFASIIGRTTQTLRNWDRSGILKPEVIEKGKKLYSQEQLDVFLNRSDKRVVGYCRVNTKNQKEFLKLQVATLSNYMEEHHYDFQIISELGSGLNGKRKGFMNLIEMIANQEVEKVVLAKKDSLLRYGNEVVEKLCKIYGCSIEYMDENINYDDYCADIVTIINKFDNKNESKKGEKVKKAIVQFVVENV